MKKWAFDPKNTKNYVFGVKHPFLVACYATLHAAMSVCRSVGRSVGRSVINLFFNEFLIVQRLWLSSETLVDLRDSG